jgi:hypothetical protein
MAKDRSDDIATRDIRRIVVCHGGDAITEFEAEDGTRTEDDDTVTTIRLHRLFILPEGRVIEAAMRGLKTRDDIGVCAQCLRPSSRSHQDRKPTPRIRDREALKACVDCGRLLCVVHRVPYRSDSSDVFRCLPCALRDALKRLRQFLFFRRT